MSIFVDSGVFYAHQDRDAPDHAHAFRAIEEIGAGRLGRALTSDYVFDEALTLTRTRTKSLDQMMALGERIMGTGGYPKLFDVLAVTGPMFRGALRILAHYRDKRLSFTDATTVALVRHRKIDSVMSFDSDFDGIIPRISPSDLGKRKRS